MIEEVFSGFRKSFNPREEGNESMQFQAPKRNNYLYIYLFI